MHLLNVRPLTGIIILILILSASMGCASGDPVAPDDCMLSETPAVSGHTASSVSARHLWGVWDIGINTGTGEVDIVPARQAELHVNALALLEPPPMMDLTIDTDTLVVDIPANYCSVDVLLTHPFPGLDEYTGFDVRGIVLMPGSDLQYSDWSLVLSSESDPHLINADGYTRWWNPREFPMPGLFGFNDGLIGKPGGAGLFTATVNGYKLFANGLGALDEISDMPTDLRGAFTAGAANRRNFEISFGENPKDWLTFQYAVDASWVEPVDPFSPDVPEDFPLSANAIEGYHTEVREVSNNLWWLDGIGMGGSLVMEVDIYSWRLDEIKQVAFDAPSIISSPATGVKIPGSGGDPDDPPYSTWMIEVLPETIESSGTKDFVITAQTEAEYNQGGLGVFFGPPGTKVSAYEHGEVSVNFSPPLKWELVTTAELIPQPFTTLKEMTVVGNPSKSGVYFFMDDYEMYRYDLGYTQAPEHMTTMEGFFGYSPLQLYGAPSAVGRFELSPFGQFVASTITDAPSPTFLGGLKRDYAFLFNENYSVNGQLPTQVTVPNPELGYFKFVDVSANYAATVEDAKIYWLQVDDPDETTPPDPDLSVLLGVYQYQFSNNPFTGDIDFISGSLVPAGSGNGEVDLTSVDRLAVDGDPAGLTGSSDLVCWFMETSPPAIECFSVVSGDDSGDLNFPLTTLTNFHAVPRDMEVIPTAKGGYSQYNWLVVLEEGDETWSIEAFDQAGQSWASMEDIPGYPVCMDIDPVNYTVHVWFTPELDGVVFAAVFDLTLG